MNNGIWITLGNSSKVYLRPIQLADVIERHEFFVKLSLADVGMVHTVDEIDFHTHETHDKIVDFTKNKRGLWLVALTAQKKIVGEIDITVKSLKRVRHNGVLSIGILPDFQSIGLGTAMMEHALSWASMQRLSRVELSVFASNDRAQNLYKKFGFAIEGIRKNFLHRQDEHFEDDILMAKHILA